MNIRTENFKIMSAAKSADMYSFEILGFSLLEPDNAKVWVNDTLIKPHVVMVDKREVPFAPTLPNLNFWAMTLLVADKIIKRDFNTFVLEIGQFLPVSFWCEYFPGLLVPQIDNIKRVSGPSSNQTTYRNSGATEYLRYKNLFETYLADTMNIKLLDWGVGCARVAQHFLHDNFEVWGGDIDEINIQWCKDNLPELNAELIPLLPPTKLPRAFFNVIVSSSVLSHLIPLHWDAWLREMYEVLAPQGTAFISFHGDHSINVMLPESSSMRVDVSSQGWCDLNASEDLGKSMEDYYRNTFFTDSYATNLFGKYFNVVEIIPGFLSGSQSVAVLKKA